MRDCVNGKGGEEARKEAWRFHVGGGSGRGRGRGGGIGHGGVGGLEGGHHGGFGGDHGGGAGVEVELQAVEPVEEVVAVE